MYLSGTLSEPQFSLCFCFFVGFNVLLDYVISDNTSFSLRISVIFMWLCNSPTFFSAMFHIMSFEQDLLFKMGSLSVTLWMVNPSIIFCTWKSLSYKVCHVFYLLGFFSSSYPAVRLCFDFGLLFCRGWYLTIAEMSLQKCPIFYCSSINRCNLFFTINNCHHFFFKLICQ